MCRYRSVIQTDVYNSFIPLGVKDSSLRLYVCHHNIVRCVGKVLLLTIEGFLSRCKERLCRVFTLLLENNVY
jgi:hypothetical protein